MHLSQNEILFSRAATNRNRSGCFCKWCGFLMYSLCGLDLGGLWRAVYVCRQSREGIELTEILPSFSVCSSYFRIISSFPSCSSYLSSFPSCPSSNPTDAIPCPTYLPLLLQPGRLRPWVSGLIQPQFQTNSLISNCHLQRERERELPRSKNSFTNWSKLKECAQP